MTRPALFASVPGAARFKASRLPPVPALARLAAAAELAQAGYEPAALEEFAFAPRRRVAGLFCVMVTVQMQRRRVTIEQRITAALRRIEAAADQPLSLEDLARNAAMSRFQFLRTFRRLVGLTPHQLVLRTRGCSVPPLPSLAVSVQRAGGGGGGRLRRPSTFNRRFRETMGLTPTAYRLNKRIGQRSPEPG